MPYAERCQWIALTMLGLIAGLALVLPLGVPIFAVLGAMAGTPVVLGIVGFVLGSAQAPVIRRHIAAWARWIVASSIGTAVGLTLGVTLVEQIGRAVVHGPVNFRELSIVARAASFGTIGLVAGAVLGLAQWLVLRRHFANCRRWVPSNALSLALGLALGSLLADALVLKSGSLASTAILLVVGSAFAALSTAKVLSAVLAQPRASESA